MVVVVVDRITTGGVVVVEVDVVVDVEVVVEVERAEVFGAVAPAGVVTGRGAVPLDAKTALSETDAARIAASPPTPINHVPRLPTTSSLGVCGSLVTHRAHQIGLAAGLDACEDPLVDGLQLTDLEEIRALKHAYFRLLDTKRFTELGELLTADVTTRFQSGALCHEGRIAVVAFLEDSLGGAGIVTMHNGHHPEITLTTEDRATGTWYLEDLVIVPAHDFELHGTAIYRDEYRKEPDGVWRISHTGYERIFERQRKPSTGATQSFKSRFDPES